MDNKGFTLVEVLVSMVLLAMIMICTVTAFKNARHINFSAEREDAALGIASSVMEQVRELDYASLQASDGDAIVSNLVFSSNFVVDTSNIVFTSSGNVTDLSFGGVYDGNRGYRVDVYASPQEYSAVNSSVFPLIQLLDSDNTCVIDDTGSGTVYNKDALDSYVVKDDSSYSRELTGTSDTMMLQEYMDKNSEYIGKKYSDKCKEIDEWNAAHPTQLLTYPVMGEPPYVTATAGELLNVIDKSTVVEMRYSSSFYYIAATISYHLDQSGARYLCDDGEDTSCEYYSVVLFGDTTYDVLTNIYYFYNQFGGRSDKIEFINGTTLGTATPYNLYFISQFEYNSSNKVLGNLGSTSVMLPDSLSLSISQVNPNPMIHVYTNCAVLDLTNAASVTNLGVKKTDPTTRMYDIIVKVTNEDGSVVYTELTSNSLH